MLTSNTVTSSLSQRFRKDRNSSFHLKHVSVVRKLQQTCHFFHCGSKLWTLGWWERGDVWGGAQSFTCIPQQGTRRELYYSALTEVVLIYVEQKLQNSGSGLVWQNKNNPQWDSFFGLGHNLLFSYSVVETKKYMSEMLQQTLSWQQAHVETDWLLWWPFSAAACLCWGEHVAHLSSYFATCLLHWPFDSQTHRASTGCGRARRNLCVTVHSWCCMKGMKQGIDHCAQPRAWATCCVPHRAEHTKPLWS